MATGRVTREKYQRLVALLEQARQHLDAMRAIDDEVAELLGIDVDERGPDEGALTDAIWNNDQTADDLLRELEVRVEEG